MSVYVPQLYPFVYHQSPANMTVAYMTVANLACLG